MKNNELKPGDRVRLMGWSDYATSIPAHILPMMNFENKHSFPVFATFGRIMNGNDQIFKVDGSELMWSYDFFTYEKIETDV